MTTELFSTIADDLCEQGFSIQAAALPASLATSLADYVRQLPAEKFLPAGIGRQQQHQLAAEVRQDSTCWINGDSQPERDWLQWVGELQQYLNRQLMLGLFSLESHFAYYPPGAFYRQHLDAFAGQANRKLSMVTYLNPDWPADAGGELVLETDLAGAPKPTGQHSVAPMLGTLVVFLSEIFPHEVLPATQERYSIATWFRVNS